MKRVTLCLAVLVATGCVSTRVTGSWTSPDYEYREYEKILVVAATDNESARSVFEGTMGQALRERGENVELGEKVLPPDAAEMDREILRQMLSGQGYDAVVVLAVVDVTKDLEYRPPEPSPGIYYGSFPAYYRHHYARPYMWGTTTARPGKVEEKVTYALEANLYDLAGDVRGIVWNAQTETTDPGSLPEFAEDYTKALVTYLYASGILGGAGG